jgi:hypothetical protein
MDEYMKPAERLAQVDAAIAAVLAGGQSYKLGSRSLTRADLAQLRALRDDLAAQAAQENSEGLLHGVYVARFDGR